MTTGLIGRVQYPNLWPRLFIYYQQRVVRLNVRALAPWGEKMLSRECLSKFVPQVVNAFCADNIYYRAQISNLTRCSIQIYLIYYLFVKI